MQQDVVVVGAGPAGVTAAVRAAELGARTTLVTRAAFGGMAANDGPVPVRTLAHASLLMDGVPQLERYGIQVGKPTLDYARLLGRVAEVVQQVGKHSALREQAERAGVILFEHTGTVAFEDAHTLRTQTGIALRADRIILCTGGRNRPLGVPGEEFTATVGDAFGLTRVPASMLVIGAGMTGVQVASIFQSFGCRVTLVQSGPRILPSEDEEVSSAVTAAFRAAGMVVHENCGRIRRVEKTAAGVRVAFPLEKGQVDLEAALAVAATGWIADTEGLNLPAAPVAVDARGYVAVDQYLATSAPHVYAAGDVTGRWMLVPQALHEGWIAATNAVHGNSIQAEDWLSPIGGFTIPEYARIGLTEQQARGRSDFIVARVGFEETTRMIVDGRTEGFCKLLVDRDGSLVGCHVVGARAVEIVQVAAIAMSCGMRIDALARFMVSFPTYTGVLGKAAYRAMRELGREFRGGAADS
jgi:dihydrolipoamide dehydrogenase